MQELHAQTGNPRGCSTASQVGKQLGVKADRLGPGQKGLVHHARESGFSTCSGNPVQGSEQGNDWLRFTFYIRTLAAVCIMNFCKVVTLKAGD